MDFHNSPLNQDQVTRADEQESLFLVKQELETMRMDNESLAEELLSTQGRCENLEQEIMDRDEKLSESFKAREDAEKTIKSKSKEIENLKNLLEQNNIEVCFSINTFFYSFPEAIKIIFN